MQAGWSLSLSLSLYLFWKSMCMYMQLWLWLTSSFVFTSKNGLNALYGLRLGFQSVFLKIGK